MRSTYPAGSRPVRFPARNGSVVLGGGEGGSVQVTGRVSASGRDGAGKVSLSGRVIEVAKGAAVTAMSRQGQGGSVSLKGDIVNNSGSVDVSGASGSAIDIAGISIGSYGAWNLQGASGASDAFTARGSGAMSRRPPASSWPRARRPAASASPSMRRTCSHPAAMTPPRSRRAARRQVTLTGERLALVAASIDASGATGGGAVRIGGDYQGGGTLAHAATTTISPATTIRADATQAVMAAASWSGRIRRPISTARSARAAERPVAMAGWSVSSKGDLVFGGSAAVQRAAGRRRAPSCSTPRLSSSTTRRANIRNIQLIDPLRGRRQQPVRLLRRPASRAPARPSSRRTAARSADRAMPGRSISTTPSRARSSRR